MGSKPSTVVTIQNTTNVKLELTSSKNVLSCFLWNDGSGTTGIKRSAFGLMRPKFVIQPKECKTIAIEEGPKSFGIPSITFSSMHFHMDVQWVKLIDGRDTLEAIVNLRPVHESSSSTKKLHCAYSSYVERQSDGALHIVVFRPSQFDYDPFFDEYF